MNCAFYMDKTRFQEELAEKMDIFQQLTSKWENQHRHSNYHRFFLGLSAVTFTVKNQYSHCYENNSYLFSL